MNFYYKMFSFRLFLLLFLYKITFASEDSKIRNPSTIDLDGTLVPAVRDSRAFWNPKRIFTPFFGKLVQSILRVTSRSSKDSNRRTEDQAYKAPSSGPSLNMHKFMESFGFAKKTRDHRREICKELGGVLINGECTQYFGRNFRRSFEDARTFCRSKGGDLWTPNLRDPFLYQKLMKYIPQIAGAKGEDLWLGVVQYNARAFTITGEDVTDSYLIQIYDGSYVNGQCFILDFPNGQFSAKDIDCRTHQEFLCEYPLTVGNEIHNS